MESFIQLSNVSKTYKTGNVLFDALKEINLQIGKGQSIAIVGKSGCGKSTLLNMIAGIDRPSNGEIEISGKKISSLNEKELTQWRGQNVGIVFQFFQLLPTLSVLDNLILPMDFIGNIPNKKRKSRAMELLQMTGVDVQAKKYPGELSGGEQQRVAIARALANDPQLIVADEPTGNLDSANSKIVKDIFKALKKQGKTVIVVTHEKIDPQEYDTVINLADGKIIKATA